MSGHDFETMAVVGQVADIVHAFKEAGSYLKRIKERRRSKPPPRGLVIDGKALQDLEFSIATGQDTVRKQYERDYRRLGQPFATGDRQATEQLKAILIDLQKSLVADLKFAYQHDQHVDFLPLQDVAADGQDRAVMCLMQLHQRVIMDVDINEIANSRPHARRQASQRSPEPMSPMNQSRQMPEGFTPEITLPPVGHINDQLPTPEQSPSYETTDYIRKNNPFRRRKLTELALESNRAASSTLPTPPLEMAIGPPPNAPLPPLPRDVSENRHRERRLRQEEASSVDTPQKETQKTFLDRAFAEVERDWEDAETNRGRHRQQQQQGGQHTHFVAFQEPHPGTPVDPSKIGEPASPKSTHSTIETSSFPSPPTPKTRGPAALTPQSQVPTLRVPTHGDGSPILDRPLTANGPINGQDHRLSTYSTATQSSHDGSSLSPSFRTSITSTTSWAATSHPPRQVNETQHTLMPSLPSSGFPTRSRPLASVPDPIYESSGPNESQSTLSLQDTQRPPASDPNLHQGYKPALSPFPPAPRVAVIETQQTLHRRQSAFSMRSANSAAASAAATIMPVRTLPPAVLDSNNQKILLPSDTNKYGGLCKSAWRAQIGDFKKAYSVERRPGGLASGRVIDYMKCKNCTFSGGVVEIDKKKKVPDRKIIIAKENGIAYRWDFLFKSHLPLKGGLKSADAEYGCMFCCAEGRGTPVFKGMATFIAHVAEHRPGVAGRAANNDLQIPEGAVVDRMDALVGRLMELDDRWEIAFPTPSGDGAYSETGSLMNSTDNRSVRSGAPSRAY